MVFEEDVKYVGFFNRVTTIVLCKFRRVSKILRYFVRRDVSAYVM